MQVGWVSSWSQWDEYIYVLKRLPLHGNVVPAGSIQNELRQEKNSTIHWAMDGVLTSILSHSHKPIMLSALAVDWDETGRLSLCPVSIMGGR